MNGPMALATPPKPDQAPIAFGRSSSAKRGGDDRQAARREQCAADALQGARGHQELDGGRQRAQGRGHGKPERADDEDASPAEAVAKRAAEQDERRERQRVAGDRPLQAGEAGVQVGTERRQRDVDDGGVDTGDTRAEHRGGHHPLARWFGQSEGTRPRRSCGSHPRRLLLESPYAKAKRLSSDLARCSHHVLVAPRRFSKQLEQ